MLIKEKKLNSDSTRDTVFAFQPTANQIFHIKSKVNETPFTQYFQGRISPYPHVFNRRAGWSPQYNYPLNIEPVKRPAYCFAPPCNMVNTLHECNNECVVKNCINTYR